MNTWADMSLLVGYGPTSPTSSGQHRLKPTHQYPPRPSRPDSDYFAPPPALAQHRTADEAAGGARAAACWPPATSLRGSQRPYRRVLPSPPKCRSARESHHGTCGTGDRGENRRQIMDPATSGLWRVVTGEFIDFRPSSFLIYSVSLVLIPHCLFLFQILMSSVISIQYAVCSRWHLQI
jgi:hypothetical protein